MTTEYIPRIEGLAESEDREWAWLIHQCASAQVSSINVASKMRRALILKIDHLLREKNKEEK